MHNHYGKKRTPWCIWQPRVLRLTELCWESLKTVFPTLQKSSVYHAVWRLRIGNLNICMLSPFSHVQVSETLWTKAHQAPLSMGFSRQVYWSGLPCPPPGDISDPRIKPMSLRSPTLAGRFFTTAPPRKTGEYDISSVQSLSPVHLFATPWAEAHKASLSISNSLSVTNSQSLLKLMSIKSVTPSNHLILCHPFLLLSSTFPSIRVFQRVGSTHRWSKCWNFSISPSNRYSRLISFRIDWFDPLVVQGTFLDIH